jgi:hypothetical protein
MNKKKDENQLAKSVIDDIIGWTESDDFIETERKQIARKAGKARADKLTAEQRSEIAKKAAQSRWNYSSESSNKS